MNDIDYFQPREITLTRADGKEVLNFPSIHKAALFLGCNQSTVNGLAAKKDYRIYTKKGKPINMVKKYKTNDYYIVKYNETNVLKNLNKK